jgi:4-hydroxy-tetrahydrodipicolinate reductase
MLRVLHLGLGEIGKGAIRAVLGRPRGMELVGVVEVHPDLVGRRLGDVMKGEKVPALRICGSVREALKKAGGADVAILTTGSTTRVVMPALLELIAAGVHVVSSCEELSYPALKSAPRAAEIDRAAKKKGVVVLGTGVNPGFAMDAFALAATAVCTRVDGIRIVRTLDAGRRRYQLQKKVAAGMTAAEVRKLIRARMVGHVGLAESVAMVAAGLGWELDRIEERTEPVIAAQAVASHHFRVKAGEVRGMRSIARGIVGGKRKIELDLTMALGAETYDEVVVRGAPAITVRTTTGFPGDASTVGMLINCATCADDLAPGLRTMLDVLRVRSVGA